MGEKITAANKGIALLKFLSKYTNSASLSMLYKMHVRSHLDYGDVIYHNQLTECSDLLESVQYKAPLIVSGCWKGTNRLKLYSELGWETLANRRHCRRLCLFYKTIKGISPHCIKFQPLWSRTNFTSRYMNSFFITALNIIILRLNP